MCLRATATALTTILQVELAIGASIALSAQAALVSFSKQQPRLAGHLANPTIDLKELFAAIFAPPVYYRSQRPQRMVE